MIPKLQTLDRDQIRDAARLGLQSAAAACVFYVIMRAFALPEVFVGTLSAVLILSSSTDGSIGLGIDRVIATVVGSTIGIICLILLPYGWGTVASLALTMLVINTIAAVRPGWRYGAVSAVALSLGAESELLEVSIDRGVSISIGVCVGILVSMIVWPERAARRYERHRTAALRALAKRLERLKEASTDRIDPVSADADREYHTAFSNARDAAKAIRLSNATSVSSELEHIRRTYNSVLILDRAFEDGWNADALAHPILKQTQEAMQTLVDRKSPEMPTLETKGEVPESKMQSSTQRDAVIQFGLQELIESVRELVADMEKKQKGTAL